MSKTNTATPLRERPLSPHLQIYKPQITSMMSILHRVTGSAMTVGLIMLTVWLLSAATGPEAYAAFLEFAGSPLGLILLGGWSLALFYHLSTGVRHLLLDTGRFFEIKNVYRTGYAALAAAAILAALFWFSILNV